MQAKCAIVRGGKKLGAANIRHVSAAGVATPFLPGFICYRLECPLPGRYPQEYGRMYTFGYLRRCAIIIAEGSSDFIMSGIHGVCGVGDCPDGQFDAVLDARLAQHSAEVR